MLKERETKRKRDRKVERDTYSEGKRKVERES